MAKYVNVAVQNFSTKAVGGPDRARDTIIRETSELLDGLRGRGVELLVTSEGVQSYGQTVEDAEDLGSPGVFLSMYRDFARREGCTVVGSCKTREGDAVFNSAVVVGPDGSTLGCYHKAFLMSGEIRDGISSGGGALVVDTPAGRLGVAICFDLNFESLRREYKKRGPALIAFPSVYHGGLQQAWWAFDCRAYVAGAIKLSDAGIFDPLGQELCAGNEYVPVAVQRINLDYAVIHLDYNRETFPDIQRKYGDEIAIDIPPRVGCCLLTSRSNQVTAADIVTEYGLELLDDYLARSIRENATNRLA